MECRRHELAGAVALKDVAKKNESTRKTAVFCHGRGQNAGPLSRNPQRLHRAAQGARGGPWRRVRAAARHGAPPRWVGERVRARAPSGAPPPPPHAVHPSPPTNRDNDREREAHTKGTKGERAGSPAAAWPGMHGRRQLRRSTRGAHVRGRACCAARESKQPPWRVFEIGRRAVP